MQGINFFQRSPAPGVGMAPRLVHRLWDTVIRTGIREGLGLSSESTAGTEQEAYLAATDRTLICSPASPMFITYLSVRDIIEFLA